MQSKYLGRLQACILGAVERKDAQTRQTQWHCHQVAVTNQTTGDK